MHVPDGMDQVDGREISHGLLVALLVQHHGGGVELDATQLRAAMGDDAGRLWSVALEPTGELGRVRLVVVKTARDDDGTIR